MLFKINSEADIIKNEVVVGFNESDISGAVVDDLTKQGLNKRKTPYIQ